MHLAGTAARRRLRYGPPDCSNGTGDLPDGSAPDNLRGDDAGRRYPSPSKGHDPAVVGRNGSLIEANIAKIGAQFAVAVERFILLQEADAILRHEDTAGSDNACNPRRTMR